MGKPTAFLELPRLSEPQESKTERVRHFREFVLPLVEPDAQHQGARCMDCGIPYCMTGCPLHNLIPDWNDLVYQADWKNALDRLHATNNFPEFTARLCPAPCEEACTLSIHSVPVGIKSIERAIIDRGWQEGWIKPEPATIKTGKRIAIVGSGPAGLACAQQLARAGHHVTVYEKNREIGGLLRYGIPDFKLEKHHIDKRIEQLKAEGVVFQTGVRVGSPTNHEGISDQSEKSLSIDHILGSYHAVVLAGGAEKPRDLAIPGRDLSGIHFAMDYLSKQNRVTAQQLVTPTNQLKIDDPDYHTLDSAAKSRPIHARNKHVVVIGGGDTGSDCIGTALRQRALTVTQLELLPMPPSIPAGNPTWPAWPLKLRTSSSQEEGARRDWSIRTKSFHGKNGLVKEIAAVRIDWTKDQNGNMSMQEIPDSELRIPADLVLLAMGFSGPVSNGLLAELGVKLDHRGNVNATENGKGAFQTSRENVFVTGDMRRGQSLIVWAIREGRRCAKALDTHLMHREYLTD
ncbi:MAG TPA: glutamate synthase subunit beta [Gemmatales bacterium]|nr:glutamate synthase subunit beta [Gemmatales bacterium]